MFRTKARTNGHSTEKVGVDELTGAWNRSGFIAAATPLFQSCQRRGASIAMAYFDFHGADSSGMDSDTVDRVLMAMAELLRKAFRSSDLIGRVDTLRFAVLLPDCTEQALAAVDGVRALSTGEDSLQGLVLTAAMVRNVSSGTLENLMRAADVRAREIKRAS